MTESEIARFFAGRKVLLTGGLGFLGKLLIEKLLRCCPNISMLYLLVRGKNGMNPNERVEQLFEMPIYKKLREEQPNFMQKLTAIESDLDLINLGLSPQHRNKLLDTNIIFHGTAIVRSNQKLGAMTNVNVRATKQILLLAKEMSDLKAFVYLSTVFAHSPIKSIEEKHYPPPMTTGELLSLVNILDDYKLESIASTLIGSWPNTFAFTKAIAEGTVLRYGGGIPACIVRPSIVTSTWKEPIMGWADSMYGPVGLLVGSSLGLLRTIHCHTDKKLDFVPADYVTSSLIAAAWDTGVRRNIAKQDEIMLDVEKVPVYNHVSSCQSPITWDTFRKYVRAHGTKDVRPGCIFWNSKLWIHRMLMYLFHLLPALVVDAASILTGQDARCYKIYKSINAHLSATSYFMTRQWYYQNEAIMKLWERMSAVDREIFKFDMDDFDWNEYTKQMVRGIGEYFVDESTREVVEKGLIEYVE